MPWSKARDAILSGKVFLDGNVVRKLEHPVNAGERLELRMSEPRAPKVPILDPERVLYYDNHIVVVNKPAGLLSVPHPEVPNEISLDRLTHNYLRKVDSRASSNRKSLGAVHRIDKDTSGLLVFTRSNQALKSLTHQFRAHSIERRYFALVYGVMKPQTVKTRLLRDNGQGIRGSAKEGQLNSHGELIGREAITHVSLEETFVDASFVSCRIETGRTHQIRIHLSETGHPIIGEKVYIRDYTGPVTKANRTLLHAGELGFDHPETGKPVAWSQDLPADMQKHLKTLRQK